MACGVMTPGMNVLLNGSCEPNSEIQPAAKSCLDERCNVCGAMSAQHFVASTDMSFACEAVQSSWSLFLWVGISMLYLMQDRHVM